jgi:hypothetical protein
VAWIGGGNLVKYLHAPGRPSWQSVEKAFEKVSQLVSDKGVPVILVIFPVVGRESSDYDQQYMFDRVTEAASYANFDILDLNGVYRQFTLQERRVSESDGHPSAMVHRQVAKAILAKLESNYSQLLLGEE